jgi:ATP-dependent helicase/nuclease subunit B
MIIPANITKSDDLGKNSSMISMKQFDILREYVNEKILEICDEMINGNIDIKPCKDNELEVCEYCNYSHICQFDVSLENNKYNIIKNLNAEKIWKSMSEKTGIDLGGEEDGN